MASPDDSADFLAPSTPSNGGSLAFKPPTRPGASLRGRKSTAALTEMNTNGPSHAPPLPTSSSSGSSSATIAPSRSAHQRLHALFDETENQTTAAAMLGQGLIQQQQRIKALREDLENCDPEHARELTQSIDAEIKDMATQKAKLLRELMPSSSSEHEPDLAAPGGMPTAPSERWVTPTRSASGADMSIGSPGPTLRQSDRRARNAAAPTSIGDQNLVNQLQEGLVQEIRRLQALLAQRDQQLKDADEGKKKYEEELALWKPKALQLVEQEDALKAENWDLQVNLDELKGVLEEERISSRKVDNERSRIAKDLAKARELADERKVQLEGQAQELERVMTLRETETALARKEKASMQRENGDLQTEVAKYKQQAMRLEQARLSRSVSNSIIHSEHSLDEDEAGLASPAARAQGAMLPASPSTHSEEFSHSIPEREVSALRGKLALAQRKTGKDSAEKRKLREQNSELRRMLAKAGINAPTTSDVESTDDEAEGDESADWVDEAGSHAGTGGRARRRGAGGMPKSSTRPNIASRLGLTSSLMEDDAELDDSFEDASGDVDQASSAGRPSLDGMDPAFADPTGTAKKDRRRSTIKPNQNKRFSTGSPLARNVLLSAGGDDDQEAQHKGAPRNRITSDIVPAGALGNELEDELAGAGEQSAEDNGASSSVVIRKEMADSEMQTDDLEQPDLLTPALAAQKAEHEGILTQLRALHQSQLDELIQSHDATKTDHEEALGQLRTHHKSQIDELIQSHDAALAQLASQHKSRIDELTRGHDEALRSRDAKSSLTSSELEKSHASALSSKEAAHAAAIAAALAAQAKTHDAGMSEARSRHAQALADSVAAHTTKLTEAEAAHKTALAERERLSKAELDKRDHRQEQIIREHKAELEKNERRHQQIISGHKAELEDVNATHDAYVSQLESHYNAAIKERDEQVIKARAEVTRLRAELDSLTAQLAEAKRQLSQAIKEQEGKVKELEAAHSAHTRALEAASAETDAVRKEHKEAEARAREAEAATLAAEAAAAASAAAAAASAAAASEDFHDAEEPSEEEGVRRVVLADLKDASNQTDDTMWAQHQQEQLALRPKSVAMSKAGETSVGPGGVTVLPARPRDSIGTFGLGRDSPAPTMYSVGAVDPTAPRSETVPDRSKPPVLAAPPPPTSPPPAHLSRKSAASMTAISPPATTWDSTIAQPPSRPTSPVPPKLAARASRGSTFEDNRAGSRASAHPPSAYVAPRSSRARPSDQDSVGTGSIMSRLSQRHPYRSASRASAASDVTSRSALSADENEDDDEVGDLTITGQGPASRGARFDDQTTDPKIIQAITQTMIGEYLWKYTSRRTTMGRRSSNAHSDKRHRRYFWVHPYTKTLYWTITDPGGARMAEGVSKSACVEDVRVVEDMNPNPAGLFHLSIIIQTGARELKVTTPNKERHEAWVNALNYLIKRDSVDGAQSQRAAAYDALTTASDAASIGRPRSRASLASRATRMVMNRTKSSDSISAYGGGYNDTTPRARGGSVSDAATMGGASYRSKRRDTAAREYLAQAAHFQRNVDEYGRRAPSATSSSAAIADDPRLLKTAEEMLEENAEMDAANGFEGLDNVRACCGGLHDVGSLANKNNPHHHHNHQKVKVRRGSNVTTGTAGGAGDKATSGRPSSRLSVASAVRPRNSRMDSTTGSTTTASRPTSRLSSPQPPQLGPLNLNAPRPSSSGVSSQSKGKESLTSMFDMPLPDTTSASATPTVSRPKSPFGSLRPASRSGRASRQV
ncbi:hypothetical protein BDZ90DRAFT_229065 [Jaminaea rosea]|uniref:PH domain-containing protein n=1 Tax=Jaminaea rosea TaxID=1569628 RepID=A0A316UXJ2_9BASI|nr:hypothetical protein BDZ90DRAFT_229065 [Jaminaea rosea]PWN30029.1 hypothetical protein BDZ90DRAFT_229065 [Jaminaea rosea]